MSLFLHRAAFCGNVEALEYGLRHMKVDQFGFSHAWKPLHSAILGKKIDAVKFLINHGAEINAKLQPESRSTWTPLLLATIIGDFSII